MHSVEKIMAANQADCAQLKEAFQYDQALLRELFCSVECFIVKAFLMPQEFSTYLRNWHVVIFWS